MNPRPYQQELLSGRRRKRGRQIRLLVALSLSLVFILWLTSRQTVKQVSSQEPSPTPTPSATPTPAATPDPQLEVHLKESLQAVVDNHPELIMSIGFLDLNTGTRVDINQDHVYMAASTNKLIAAYSFLKKVEEGSSTLDQKMGTRDADYHLKQMINRSNNDSWAQFNSYLTLATEAAYAKGIGITTYDGDNNAIAPKDIMLLLEKLYRGTLLNKEHSTLLLSYMKNTNEESLIPAGLPSTAVAYHKYGEFEDNVHDAAIVYDGDHRYVLTIYSNGKGYYGYEKRAQTFHEATKAINDLMD
jgi:beta-lactamase class A